MPARSLARRAVLGLSILALLSCSRRYKTSDTDHAPAHDEFSVMTFNVMRWCFDDRDAGGQRNDPKPESEKAAVIDLISKVRPDVLAVEEMGNPKLFDEFRGLLRKAGLDYPNAEFIPSGEGSINIALLTRFPIVSRQSITNESYTIGDSDLPVQRGFISVDIQPSPDYRFRLMVAHLKSKIYSSHGQTEMRRNEARLLNKHVRRALDQNTNLNLLVVGDLNDNFGSAAIREAMGNELIDLRPADVDGDIWSHFWEESEEYSRIDYLLVSAGMKPEVVSDKTYVVRDRLTYQASDHRPIVGVFKMRDR